MKTKKLRADKDRKASGDDDVKENTEENPAHPVQIIYRQFLMDGFRPMTIRVQIKERKEKHEY